MSGAEAWRLGPFMTPSGEGAIGMSNDPEVEKYLQARQREFERESQIEELQNRIGDLVIALGDAESAGSPERARDLRDQLMALRAELKATRLSE